MYDKKQYESNYYDKKENDKKRKLVLISYEACNFV